MLRRKPTLVASAAIVSLILTGCAASGATPEAEIVASDGSTAYPLTVDNCGEEVVFSEPPERVVLLETAPVTILDGLGVLDRVVSMAGTFSPEYYEPDLADRLSNIDLLSDEIDASGHLMINSEIVLAQEPDLVLGLPEGITREGLRDGGAGALVQPIYCPTGVGDTTFEQLYEQVLTYGQIFDRNAEAAALVADLEERVAAVEAKTASAPDRTAAVLYPSVGGGPLYTYGRASMAQPQLEAAGFTNVFEDASERVFEVSVEEIIDRDPDVIVLLYQGSEAGVLDEVANLPGSDALGALERGDVLIHLFNFTEPPSPLSVTGLELISERFGTAS